RRVSRSAGCHGRGSPITNMTIPKKRVAVLSPVAWRTPPRQYGAWETVASKFDLIHSHYDFMALSYTRLVKTPVLTTIHGFSSPKIMPMYEKYRDRYFVSISNSDRAPGLNYLATVYNGIDLSLYPIQGLGGDHLVFLGRIHPDKRVHLAIEAARLS